jgi:transposase
MLSKQKICHIARFKKDSPLSAREVGDIVGCSHQSVIRYRYFIERHNLHINDMVNTPKGDLLKLFFPNYPYRQIDKIEPDYQYIHRVLMGNRKQTIFNCWLDYIASAGQKAIGRSQFYQGYRHYRKAQKLSMKMNHRAGEIIFVDYAGTTLNYGRPGKTAVQKAQIFVGILGYSQKMFAYATPRQTTTDWIEAQIAMLEYFGGVPEIIVPDNPLALVNTTKQTRVIASNYERFSVHYGVSIVFARVRAPQDKALAEQAVGFITNRILADMKNMRFFSLDEMNAYLSREVEKLNDAPFQKRSTTRNIEFERLDKPKLGTLPQKRLALVEQVLGCRVPENYMVEVAENAYSVPYQYAHKPVDIHVTRRHVTVLHDMQEIAKHPRSYEKGEEIRITEHMHPDHQYMEDKALEYYWLWAEQFGEAVQKIMSLQFTGVHPKSFNANIACRKIQSSYEKSKISSEDFERACQFALDYSQTTPTHIKLIVSSNAYDIQNDSPPVDLQTHANLRGKHYYDVTQEQGEHHE